MPQVVDTGLTSGDRGDDETAVGLRHVLQGQLPPVRWERFVHRDDDGPLIIGRAAHDAAGMADVYGEVERAQRGELLDGYLFRE